MPHEMGFDYSMSQKKPRKEFRQPLFSVFFIRLSDPLGTLKAGLSLQRAFEYSCRDFGVCRLWLRRTPSRFPANLYR